MPATSKAFMVQNKADNIIKTMKPQGLGGQEQIKLKI